jgi:hypothetical protein
MGRSKFIGKLLLLGICFGNTLAFVRPVRRNGHALPLFVIGDQPSVENEIRVLTTADMEDKDTPLVTIQQEINGYSMPLGQKMVGYSAFLDGKKGPWAPKLKQPTPKYDIEMNEDGYANLQRSSTEKLMRFASFPLRMAKELWKGSTIEPGALILVRHGESEWNANKTFTGWADPDLTEQGKREVEHAARLLMEGGYKIDVVFTSRLKRAIRSVWILLQEFNQVYLPVFKSWRLNERMVSWMT